MPTVSPPGFPARPVNGGPLHKARPKRGNWVYEPKVNGWRAWVHVPTGAMFNRQNERLSIEQEFQPVLRELREWWSALALKECFTWLDTEAFERRHKLGRGSLIILDAPLVPETKLGRDNQIFDKMVSWTGNGIAKSWKFLHEPPPENSILSFAYTFKDYQIPPPAGKDWLADQGHYRGEDLDGIHTVWRQLQQVNQKLRAELFEGLVAKRADSPYPMQLRSPDHETMFWMKHRWRF